MVKVIKLAHVGLNALDLSKQAEFYNDKWGLERIDEFGGEMFFRAEGPAHHVLTLHENAAPGMHHVALEVATPDEIDQAYEELQAAGIDVVTPPAQELEPGVARAIRFKDPDGFLVELVAGVDAVRDPYGQRDVKPQDLNHVVLNVGDVDRSEAFYRDLLGFKMTDRFIGGLSFWGLNPQPPPPGFRPARDGQGPFHHPVGEKKDWEEGATEVLRANGASPTEFGGGRNLLEQNLFVLQGYPGENAVVPGEVEQLTDPDRQPRLQEPLADVWVSANRA